MGKRLHGLIPAIVIPFDENLKINEYTLEKYVEIVCSAKIVAIAVNTDAGEGSFLCQEDREKILRIVKKHSKNIPVICGLGGTTTGQVIEYGRRYKVSSLQDVVTN